MQPGLPSSRSAAELLDHNRRFYDMLWSGARLVEPQRFNTWPLVQSLLPGTLRRLEVGPGLRPRLPIEGTQFLDISAPALELLRQGGGRVTQSELTAMPFEDATFDLLCALDVIEHVDDGDSALAELSRVARPGATLLISAPLHAARWSVFDELVGHKRRYEPASLLAALAGHRFAVERSAVFGMQPKSSRLLDIGMWWLSHHRKVAMDTYNRLFMPLGLRLQKELALVTGMLDPKGVDEVLLICRRQPDTALDAWHAAGDRRALRATQAPAARPATPPEVAMVEPGSFVNFAYGSNMSSRRLRQRTPSARPLGIGRLDGHRLAWHMRGSDGSAKCDILETGRAEDIVWGVLYEIAGAEKPLLDRAEGLGHAYSYKMVQVRTADRVIEAGAYVAIDTDASRLPYDWYLGFVLAGAHEHGLPSDYAEGLRALETAIDADAERRERNLAILREG